VIPRRQALALVAAGSHYITNFDADSAWQAASRPEPFDKFGLFFLACEFADYFTGVIEEL